VAGFCGAMDGYLVPRAPGDGAAIDVREGVQVLSATTHAVPYGTPRGNLVRANLLEITVQFRVAAAAPMRWAVSPVADVYLCVLERTAAAVDARARGMPCSDDVFVGVEAAVAWFLEGVEEERRSGVVAVVATRPPDVSAVTWRGSEGEGAAAAVHAAEEVEVRRPPAPAFEDFGRLLYRPTMTGTSSAEGTPRRTLARERKVVRGAPVGWKYGVGGVSHSTSTSMGAAGRRSARWA
jgi:hypothetical protein